MCGIAGVVGRTLREDVLRQILSQIEHRGRSETLSECKHYMDYGTCLGTNRLPIVRPNNNTQPALSKNRQIALVMNAQIFNYKELAHEHHLEWINESEYGDTQFLVEFIELYGIDFVIKQINWEGSFIYLDMVSREVVFVRDHLGIKPLYYLRDGDLLMFSSEIKGLTGLPGDEIVCVQPGSINRYSLENNNITTTIWWEPCAAFRDCNLLELLSDSVGLRVPEGQYAILLSGGLDSSIIVSLAKKFNRSVTAYTLFTDTSPDLPYARSLCNDLNIPLVEVKGESSEVLKDKLPDIVHIVETWQWQVINHSAPMDALFKRIRDDGHKVVLTGEGADELFFGYEDFQSPNLALKEKERVTRIKDLHKTNCRRLDRMAMAYGLECRVPFLDRRLVSAALSYSYPQCVSGTINKIPLRKMGDKLLPKGFSDRKKLSLSKGAGYKYGENLDMKNVFGRNNDFESEMKNTLYEYMAKYPIERYLIDLAVDEGYFKAKYLQKAGL